MKDEGVKFSDKDLRWCLKGGSAVITNPMQQMGDYTRWKERPEAKIQKI